MEYTLITIFAIVTTTLIVHQLANRLLGIRLSMKPLALCALCSLFLSLILPRVIVGFAGLAGTVGVLAVFAIIFAYFVAYYEESRTQASELELMQLIPVELVCNRSLVDPTAITFISDVAQQPGNKMEVEATDIETVASQSVELLNATFIDNKPEPIEPELVEPEVTESELIEPEVTEPELIEPEVTEPELIEPEVFEPELIEPEMFESELIEPEVFEPELIEPELFEPELIEPEVIESELVEPESESFAVTELLVTHEATENTVLESDITNEEVSLTDHQDIPIMATVLEQEKIETIEVVQLMKEEMSQVAVLDLDLQDMDELLDYAFLQKEQHNFQDALLAFRQIVKLYPDSSAAPFAVIEIGNILKMRGAYDDAILAFAEAKTLPALQNNYQFDQEFVSTIAYLRIVKNVLVHRRLGFLPYEKIPADAFQEIDAEFREWRNLV